MTQNLSSDDHAILRAGVPARVLPSLLALLGPCAGIWIRRGGDLRVARVGDVGPESRFQPHLHEGHGARIRPRLSGQNLADSSMVQAASACDVTQGGVAGDVPNSQDEETYGLGGGILCDPLVGPGVGQLARGGSDGSGHVRRVRPASGKSRFRHTVYVPTYGCRRLAVCSNIQSEGGHDAFASSETEAELGTLRTLSVADRIYVETFCPKAVEEAAWVEVQTFVRQAVLDVLPHRKSGPQAIIQSAAPYVAWCRRVAGLPLERESIFDREVVLAYVESGLPGYSDGSRATRRSTLLSMSDVLLPHDQRSVRMERIGRNPASAPYTAAEIARLREWASAQRTPYKRHGSWALLAFGLGAGLRTHEISDLRREDVQETPVGVLVTVRHDARVVPMLAEWENEAVVLAECVKPGALLYRADRDKPRAASLAWDVGHSFDRPRFSVSVPRMRATWIVGHLNRRVPLRSLMDAAGVQGLTAFERFIDHLDDVAAVELHDAYRAERREVLRGTKNEYMRGRREAMKRYLG